MDCRLQCSDRCLLTRPTPDARSIFVNQIADCLDSEADRNKCQQSTAFCDRNAEVRLCRTVTKNSIISGHSDSATVEQSQLPGIPSSTALPELRPLARLTALRSHYTTSLEDCHGAISSVSEVDTSAASTCQRTSSHGASRHSPVIALATEAHYFKACDYEEDSGRFSHSRHDKNPTTEYSSTTGEVRSRVAAMKLQTPQNVHVPSEKISGILPTLSTLLKSTAIQPSSPVSSSTCCSSTSSLSTSLTLQYPANSRTARIREALAHSVLNCPPLPLPTEDQLRTRDEHGRGAPSYAMPRPLRYTFSAAQRQSTSAGKGISRLRGSTPVTEYYSDVDVGCMFKCPSPTYLSKCRSACARATATTDDSGCESSENGGPFNQPTGTFQPSPSASQLSNALDQNFYVDRYQELQAVQKSPEVRQPTRPDEYCSETRRNTVSVLTKGGTSLDHFSPTSSVSSAALADPLQQVKELATYYPATSRHPWTSSHNRLSAGNPSHHYSTRHPRDPTPSLSLGHTGRVLEEAEKRLPQEASRRLRRTEKSDHRRATTPQAVGGGYGVEQELQSTSQKSAPLEPREAAEAYSERRSRLFSEQEIRSNIVQSHSHISPHLPRHVTVVAPPPKASGSPVSHFSPPYDPRNSRRQSKMVAQQPRSKRRSMSCSAAPQETGADEFISHYRIPSPHRRLQNRTRSTDRGSAGKRQRDMFRQYPGIDMKSSYRRESREIESSFATSTEDHDDSDDSKSLEWCSCFNSLDFSDCAKGQGFRWAQIFVWLVLGSLLVGSIIGILVVFFTYMTSSEDSSLPPVEDLGFDFLGGLSGDQGNFLFQHSGI